MSLVIGAGSFETIRNNTALKHLTTLRCLRAGFETIRNNTALKPYGKEIGLWVVLKPFETTQL